MSKKADRSPVVGNQRDKVKKEFIVKPFKWTDKQTQFIDIALNDKKNQIIFCKSPPGTGKTLLSLYCCLELLKNKLISNICYLRNPVESVGKGIGFIKGDIDEKLNPYGGPLFDHLNELLQPATIKELIDDKRIEVESVGFIKGRTYNCVGLIMDEAEDLSIKELRLLMGRLGKFSKLFIIGDDNQKNVKDSGFNQVFNLFKDDVSKENGIVTFEFTKEDIMRNQLLQFVMSKFENII